MTNLVRIRKKFKNRNTYNSQQKKREKKEVHYFCYSLLYLLFILVSTRAHVYKAHVHYGGLK